MSEGHDTIAGHGIGSGKSKFPRRGHCVLNGMAGRTGQNRFTVIASVVSPGIFCIKPPTGVMMVNVRFSAILMLAITAAGISEAKKPKPAPTPIVFPHIEQDWEIPGYGEVHFNIAGGSIGGVSSTVAALKNLTTLKITSARAELRQYRQPLSGMVISSLYAYAGSIPAGERGAMTSFTSDDLAPGCALIIDSINITFEDGQGASHPLKLNAPSNTPPLWYIEGPACAIEQRAYESTRASSSTK